MLAKVLKNRKLFHRLLRTAYLAQQPVVDRSDHSRTAPGSGSGQPSDTGFLRHLPMIFPSDHNFRRLPAITRIPFRDRFARLNQPVDNPRFTIALFSGCVQDFVYPQHREAAMKGFARHRINVVFPMNQSCCGFGGSFSTTFPAVSREILTRKLDDVMASKADLLVTECPGCVLQLKGGAVQQGRDISVCHIAELLFP
jgi:Fe-S oxidoreductase